MRRRLPRSFYRRDSREVAPELLNKLLVMGDRTARLVEVEAYAGAEDPGSHAYRGKTARNATMFGPAGHLYVYFTYGMHFCANAVCGDVDDPTAVLLRAAVPVEGQDHMRAERPTARRDIDLCRGPARMCRAFGIDRAFNGADLVTGNQGVVIVDDGTPPPESPATSPRVGLSAGAELPWRYYIAGHPGVSRR